MYTCPVCQQTLTESTQEKSKTLRCEQGHSFDRHKKGYVNLLLAHNKRSKQPGDDAEMVAGRRMFLNAGYYHALAKQISDMLSAKGVRCIVDAGCGEGYYLREILALQPELSAWGFDISKPAIQQASQTKQVEWAVASSARMPYADASFDCVLSVFSRVDNDEFLRVLKPRGFVLYAGPGPDHLMCLRQLIYSEIRSYEVEKHHDYFGESFDLVESMVLKVPFELDDQTQIHNLLSMTPHSQRVTQEGLKRLTAVASLSDEADFRLYLYQKK